MKLLSSQKVFSVGSQSYSWEEVVLAAQMWGEWAILEEQLREGIACCKLAEGRDDGPSDAEVNAAARAFRYERGLISAEETEMWLERWGLTIADWRGYLRRSLARLRWVGELGETATRQIPDREVDPLIKSEAICSGQLSVFAWKLASRAAIHGKMGDETEGAFLPDSTNHEPGTACTTVKSCSLAGIEPAASSEIVELLTAMERSFTRFASEVRTPRVIEDQVRSHYLAWIRLRCLYASFPDGEMAQEAAQWVRQDGMTLETVASEAKADLQEASFYLEQLESDLSSQLVGARKGEFLGPLLFGGAPTLLVVLDKVMPSTDDPELQIKAEETALQSAIDIEVADRVRWNISL